MERYDELYVISDLHIGGKGEFQMLQSSKLLAGFIRSLATPPSGEAPLEADDAPHGYAAPPKESVALLLNGDIVDYLAETPTVFLDIKNGAAKLNDIMSRESFSEIFDALETFVKTPNRWLVLVLGNHDVELALPKVQDALLARIAGEDLAHRGKVIIAMDGTGYRCEVGGALVYCFHGEISDTFNRVNHQQLREVVLESKLGRDDYEWEPNAGTELVVNLMNELKKKRPFVDLLKPVFGAVVPLLRALDEATFKRAVGLGSPAMRGLKTWATQDRYLRDDGEAPAMPEPSELTETVLALEEALRRTDSRDALASLEEDLASGVDPLVSAGADDEDELLTVVDTMKTLGRVVSVELKSFYWSLAGLSPEEILRKTLLELTAKDESFEVAAHDEPFAWVERNVEPEVKFAISGHTHHERAIKRSGGTAYFNSGTWACLMRLTEKHLASKEAFEPVLEALRGPDGESGDSVRQLLEKNLAFVLPTVVAVRRTDDGATGELCYARQVGADVRLSRRPDTRISL